MQTRLARLLLMAFVTLAWSRTASPLTLAIEGDHFTVDGVASSWCSFRISTASVEFRTHWRRRFSMPIILSDPRSPVRQDF